MPILAHSVSFKKCIRVLSYITNAFVYITSAMHGFQQGAQLSQHQQQPQHIQAPSMHPLGPEQLQQVYQHGIHLQPLSHRQPCYTQTQHSVKEPPLGKQQPRYSQARHSVKDPPLGQQQTGYQYGVQHPLPDWQQPGYIQQQHDFEPPPGQQQSQYTQLQHSQYPPPGQQQPGYPQAQYGNQHPPAGQQYHTNTQLQQPPPSGQFTGERQGILGGK